MTDQLPNISSALKCKALLQSVISATICLLGHDLSAWHQSVNVVCQLSCNVSAQLHPISSDQTRQLSCTLLAQIKLVNSAATCWLKCRMSSSGLCPHGCSLSTQLVFCQLGCNMSAHCHSYMVAQLKSLSSLPLVQFLSAQLVRVKLLAPRHSAFNVAHTPPSAQDDTCCY